MAVKVVGPEVPQRGNFLSRWLGRAVLRMMRFTIEGDVPNLPKFVIVAAPHTSNWDWVVAMAFLFATNFQISWLGKDSLFKGPVGPLMRWFGGVPVDRSAAHGTVGEAINLYKKKERFVLGVTPEGTRSKVRQWKTGFYRIAEGANVPLLLFGFDFGRRQLRVGPLVPVTGDMEGDIAQLQAHFHEMTGKNPRQGL